MKPIFSKFKILFFLFFFLSNAYSNDKIVYVDMNVLINNSKAGLSINKQMQKLVDSNNSEYEKLEKSLLKEENDILKKKNVLDPEKFNEDKGIEINVDKEKIVLSKDDIEVHYKDIEGLSVASGNGVTIAIDLELNETLIEEGIARELISRIQNVRKASGFEVTDKIEVKIKKDPKLISPIKNNLNYILSEILATKLYFSDDFEKNDETIEFDEIKTVINLRKA